MDYFQPLVHVGYSLMLCALLARDILWLRAILVAAQGVLAVYAFHIGVPSIAGWNAAFVLINVIWVARILKERRDVQLAPELARIHEQSFAALTAPEFLRLWSWGQERALQDSMLAREGDKPEFLYFIVAGGVRVERQGKRVAHLSAGSFVAEMSLLTGEAATADARSDGAAVLRCWPVDKLAAVRARNPALWSRIQSVLGHDVVEKIKRASAL